MSKNVGVYERLPRILILPEARRKLDLYINLAEGEIGGLGTVRKSGKDFIVEDVYLLEQKANAANVNIDMAVVAKFHYQMMKKGFSNDAMKFFWHSHADFEVFWSKTDDTMIDLFRDWMISVVGNKKGEWRTRIDISDPICCTVHNLPFDVYLGEVEGLHQEIETEIAAKVQKIVRVKKNKENLLIPPDPLDVSDLRGSFECENSYRRLR
jgi:hypothetical protein